MNKWNWCYWWLLLLPATVNIDWPHCTDSSCTHATSRPNCFAFFIAHKMNLIYVFLSSNQENGISSIRSRFSFSELLLFAQSRIQQKAVDSSINVGRRQSQINDSRRSELLLLFGWYFHISFVIGETFAFFTNFPMIGESELQRITDIWSILPTSQ